jgi:hypothetical protein
MKTINTGEANYRCNLLYGFSNDKTLLRKFREL